MVTGSEYSFHFKTVSRFHFAFFSRGHATLELAVSVGRSVRQIFDSRVVFALPLLPNRPRLDCRVSGLVDYHKRGRRSSGCSDRS